MSEIEDLRAELERLRLDAVDEARWAVAQFRRAEAAEAEVERLKHERGLLAEAIVKIGMAAGSGEMGSMTGPELLMYADDAATESARLASVVAAIEGLARTPDGELEWSSQGRSGVSPTVSVHRLRAALASAAPS